MKTIPAKPAWAKAWLSIVVTVLPVACFAGDVSPAAPAAKAKSEQPIYDLVVYGGSSGAVVAAIAAAYNTNCIRSFEPHVAKKVFEKMLADAGLTLIYNEKLDRLMQDAVPPGNAESAPAAKKPNL